MASVDLQKDGFIATIVFNRPEKLNALTKEMTQQLFEAVHEVNRDDQVRNATHRRWARSLFRLVAMSPC